MPGSPSEIADSLLIRVGPVNLVNIIETGPFEVTVEVGAWEEANIDDADLIRLVEGALQDIGMAHIRYTVRVSSSLRGGRRTFPDGKYRLATTWTDPSRNGVLRYLKRLLPSGTKAVVEELKPDSSEFVGLRLLVSDGRGECSPELLAEAKKALDAIMSAGAPYEVRPKPKDDLRNHLDSDPRRTRRETPEVIHRAKDRDEEAFAASAIRLFAGRGIEIPLVDNFSGHSVATLASSDSNSVTIGCFLPLSDRILVNVPTKAVGLGRSVFEQYLGLAEKDYLQYARAGKVVLLFQDDYENYPVRLVQRILEDPSLPYLSKRSLDLLAVRHVWTRSEYLRNLPTDRSMTAGMYGLLKANEQALRGELSPAERREAQRERDVLAELLRFVEGFEGMAWDMGHRILGIHGSNGPFGVILRSFLPHVQPSLREHALPEALSTAHSLGLARSLRASLHHDQLSEPFLRLASSLYGPSSELSVTADSKTLSTLLGALEISYDATIPADEYMDIFDAAETRRLRRIIEGLVAAGNAEGRTEIDNLVQSYNAGVRKIRKRDILKADVDVLGNAADEGSTLDGGAVGIASKVLRGLRAPIQMLGDRLIEDTRLGSAVDAVRGFLNNVPKESIRLFRIQRKLARRRHR